MYKSHNSFSDICVINIFSKSMECYKYFLQVCCFTALLRYNWYVPNSTHLKLQSDEFWHTCTLMKPSPPSNGRIHHPSKSSVSLGHFLMHPSCSFLLIQILTWYGFFSTWRTNFYISYCAGLLAKYSCRFRFIDFVSLLHLQILNVFFCVENSVWHLFSFSALHTLFHFLLICILSDKKSEIILVFIPQYVMCHFLWMLLMFSLYHWFQTFAYGVLWCGFLCVYLAWVFLLFSDLWVYNFH